MSVRVWPADAEIEIARVLVRSERRLRGAPSASNWWSVNSGGRPSGAGWSRWQPPQLALSGSLNSAIAAQLGRRQPRLALRANNRTCWCRGGSSDPRSGSGPRRTGPRPPPSADCRRSRAEQLHQSLGIRRLPQLRRHLVDAAAVHLESAQQRDQSPAPATCRRGRPRKAALRHQIGRRLPPVSSASSATRFAPLPERRELRQAHVLVLVIVRADAEIRLPLQILERRHGSHALAREMWRRRITAGSYPAGRRHVRAVAVRAGQPPGRRQARIVEDLPPQLAPWSTAAPRAAGRDAPDTGSHPCQDEPCPRMVQPALSGTRPGPRQAAPRPHRRREQAAR